MPQRGRYHTAGTAIGAPAGLFGHFQLSADDRYHSGRESGRGQSCGGGQRATTE
jgi:hypothetical protein